MKIYCDMDGVLTDFPEAFKNIDGRTQAQVKAAGEDFWKHIESAGEDFWTFMPWTKDGKILWEFIKDYHPSILTAPSEEPNSKTGKIKWVQRELGTHIPVNFSNTKYEYANKSSILIDDKKQKIIEPWIKAGGIGIHHTSAENSIRQLKRILK